MVLPQGGSFGMNLFTQENQADNRAIHDFQEGGIYPQ